MLLGTAATYGNFYNAHRVNDRQLKQAACEKSQAYVDQNK